MTSIPMIDTQSNETKGLFHYEKHLLDLPQCCPVTHNPQLGSTIEIGYIPKEVFLEVDSLKKYIDSYVGGKGNVRSMEGMIQQISQDCANTLKTRVRVTAKLIIEPGQRMEIICRTLPT